MAQKRGLGKGITALIPLNDPLLNSQAINKNTIVELDINKIEPNKEQPRKNFNEQSLNELAESISNYGLIQPIVVKKTEDYYMIITGERRWRASRIAGLKAVPCIVKEYSSQETLEVSLIENIQRENLNPIEEAKAYNILINEFNLTQENVAEKVGKSRSNITNILRLLNLDSRVQNFIIENKITSGHARALLAIEDNNIQFELAEKIIEDSLSVRQVELLVKSMNNKLNKPPKEEEPKEDNPIYKNIELEFSNILGTKVQISRNKKKGKIEIEYYSDEDLERLISLIKEIKK